jgi:STE24 endopeptidase
VLALGIAWLMATFHIWMGDALIFLFAGFMFLLSLAVTFLYPVFSRIGNKFVPLEDGELKDRLMALLEKHGYRVKAIEVMDASRRTTKLNAYFTGFGKMKTIVLFDNLLNAMTPDEICAVFAHELGHGLNKDVLRSQILNIGNLILMSVIAWGAAELTMIYPEFGFAGVNYGFTYILFAIGLALMQPLTGLIMNANSRFAEYRADRQAVKEGYGEPMTVALKKLAKDNFSHPAPSKFIVVMEYSHPPLSQRIAAVEKEMANK